MANLDCPDLERCRLLAEAGWPQDVCAGDSDWWVTTEAGEVWLGSHRDAMIHESAVAAPTLGEMLAYSAQRGWECSVSYSRRNQDWDAHIDTDRPSPPCPTCGDVQSDVFWGEGQNTPPNAMAEALAAAMQASKEAPDADAHA